jgi:uncharacterized GH25 family protein
MRKKGGLMTFKKNNQEKKTFEPKGLKITFQGETFVTLERKKQQDLKPKYYLFNIEKKFYLSSLYPTGEENTYYFDVKDDGKYLLRLKIDDLGTYRGYEIEEL